MSTPGDAGSTVASLRSVLTESVQSATAAPSLHNSQPWLFHLGHDRVDVYADRRRQLEVLDPTGRALLSSVRAGVFTLRLAMQHRGYRPAAATRRRPACAAARRGHRPS